MDFPQSLLQQVPLHLMHARMPLLPPPLPTVATHHRLLLFPRVITLREWLFVVVGHKSQGILDLFVMTRMADPANNPVITGTLRP
jgi:hypothetical protein